MSQFDVTVCPNCGSQYFRIINSRSYDLEGVRTMRRRRSCLICDHRETTLELPERLMNIAEMGDLIKELRDE